MGESSGTKRMYRKPRIARARIVVTRQPDQIWARPESRRLTVLRVTARYVVATSDDGLAYFDRATGKGGKSPRGGVGGGSGGRDGADWSDWKLSWADWDRYHVAEAE
jgi:hypothetical protein